MKKPLLTFIILGFISTFRLIGYAQADSASTEEKEDPIARIREEGLNHSKVMETLASITEVIGPRLTGSPNLKRANEWTRDQLERWGLTNAHLEGWGPFGRGWSLKRFSAQVVEPQTIPLIGYPSAWSPGLERTLVSDVVYFEGGTNDMEKLKGRLEGKIVLVGSTREVRPRYEPMAVRIPETNLLHLANVGDPNDMASATNPGGGNRGGFGRAGGGDRAEVSRRGSEEGGSRTNSAGRGDGPGRRSGFRGRPGGLFRSLPFLMQEKAAVVISPSFQGDGGTFFVSSASVPGSDPFSGGLRTNVVRAWSTNVPSMPAQVTLAAEDFNRLVRMIEGGEHLKMAVDLQVRFHDDDLMAYNTIAEIPGSDLKKEIVMVGGHLDSWHSGTGATDNGAGVAAAMEAVRIISALKLQPRRTIRIGLWSGEEQGLLGSKAYVSKHFGYYTNHSGGASGGRTRAPKDEETTGSERKSSSTNSASSRQLVRGSEYNNFSAYFNLDNGAGKIRGVYMQGNEAVRALFRRWLEPFSDEGADTLTLSNTGGTDHNSFDAIGLPGFQFIQDPLDYWTRTHHSNQDLYDRVPPDDLKQAATILAAFVYKAAMEDEKLPRKPRDL